MPDINGLPYPALSDPNNPPADFLALATAVDGKLSAINASQITAGTLPITRGGTGATNAVDAASSLRVGLVNLPVAASSSGGSYSQTALGKVTFTGVNVIYLGSTFSSDFQNYRIVYTQNAASATGYAALQLTAGGTPLASGYNQIYLHSYLNGTFNHYSGTTTALHITGSTNTSGQPYMSVIDVANPNVASQTGFTFHGHGRDATNIYAVTGSCGVNSSSAYNGFNIYPISGGTISGTVQVFGYND